MIGTFLDHGARILLPFSLIYLSANAISKCKILPIDPLPASIAFSGYLLTTSAIYQNSETCKKNFLFHIFISTLSGIGAASFYKVAPPISLKQVIPISTFFIVVNYLDTRGQSNLTIEELLKQHEESLSQSTVLDISKAACTGYLVGASLSYLKISPGIKPRVMAITLAVCSMLCKFFLKVKYEAIKEVSKPPSNTFWSKTSRVWMELGLIILGIASVIMAAFTFSATTRLDHKITHRLGLH